MPITRGSFIRGALATVAALVAKPFVAVADSIQGKWSPTPWQERIRAKLTNGTVVDYCDLTLGTIFQPVKATDASVIVDPFTGEVAEDELWARCSNLPVRGFMRTQGYAVEIDVLRPTDLWFHNEDAEFTRRIFKFEDEAISLPCKPLRLATKHEPVDFQLLMRL